VTATGTLSALVTVQVGTQVSGRIAKLHADYNSPVRKGDVLATIDPELFLAAREQCRAAELSAQGALAQAKAQALYARRQCNRDRQLRTSKLLSEAEADGACTTADVDEAAVVSASGALAQAKASLHQAELNLEYTIIRSPVDGTVISRAVDAGQTVAASFSTPTLFTIAQDLRRMQIDTSVAEGDIGRLTPGMRSTFTVDAYPREKFDGTVRQIRNAATTTSNVVTYDAVIDVSNPDLRLRPGMTATVSFVWAQADDVLRVSNAALRFKPDESAFGMGPPPMPGSGGQSLDLPKRVETTSAKTVYLLRDRKLTPVTIEAGMTDGSVTEVRGGTVRAGDLAVTDAEELPDSKSGPPFRRIL
jgi:HlyD family secretion protein